MSAFDPLRTLSLRRYAPLPRRSFNVPAVLRACHLSRTIFATHDERGCSSPLALVLSSPISAPLGLKLRLVS
jgi:hypothetical protein